MYTHRVMGVSNDTLNVGQDTRPGSKPHQCGSSLGTKCVKYFGEKKGSSGKLTIISQNSLTGLPSLSKKTPHTIACKALKYFVNGRVGGVFSPAQKLD